MGRFIISSAFGIIGNFLGGPLFGRIGFAVGSFIAGRLFQDTQVVEGPRLEDLAVTDGALGAPLALHWGTNRLAGNLMWVKNNQLDEVKIETELDLFGKGFGPSITTVNYEYFATFALAWTGPPTVPIDGVLRAWANFKLIWDFSAQRLEDDIAAGGAINATVAEAGIIGTFNTYLGTATQSADPHIQADRGAANTPAFRGLAYTRFVDFPLTADFGNRIPNIEGEVVRDGVLANPQTSDLTNNPAVNPEQFHIDPYDNFLWAAAEDRLTRWDLHTLLSDPGSLDYSNVSEPNGGLMQVQKPVAAGDDGFLYGGGTPTASFTTGRLYKYDKDTLDPVAQIGPNGALESLSWLVFRHYKGRRKWLIGGGFNKDIQQYDATAFGLLTNDIEVSNSALTLWDKDSSDILWGVSYTGSDSTLLKYVTLGNAVSGASTLLIGSWSVTSTFGTLLRSVRWDEDLGYLFLDGGGIVAKWDVDAEAIDSTVTYDSASQDNRLQWNYGPQNGQIWLLGPTNDMFLVDLRSMTVIDSFDATSDTWGAPTLDSCSYVPAIDGFLCVKASNLGAFIGWRNRLDPQNVAISAIIDEVSGAEGLNKSTDPSPQVDISGVSGVIRGYTVKRQSQGRRILEPLLRLDQIDVGESDKKVKFFERGGAIEVTVLEDDLGAGLEDAADENLTETILQEIDLPEELLMEYINADGEYDRGIQAARRAPDTVNTTEAVTLKMPVALTDTQAAQYLERFFVEAWTKRYNLRYNVPLNYLSIAPGTVAGVTRGRISYRAYTQKTSIGDVMEIEADAVINAIGDETPIVPTFFTTGRSGIPSNIPTQELEPTSNTKLILMDTPLLRDVDDVLEPQGFYAAAGPINANSRWDGAQAFRSVDDIDYSPWEFFGSRVITGTAQNALGGVSNDQFVKDITNTVDITLSHGDSLSSITELQMLNGGNPALLESRTQNEWEVIQFQTAEQTGTQQNKWTLSNLLRGRRGTQHLISEHEAGDRFVLLSTSTIKRVGTSGDKGNERFYKAVTLGQVFTPSGATAFTSLGLGEKPYAAANVTGTRDGSNNLDIDWERCTRIGEEDDWLNGVTNVPLVESANSWELDFLDGPLDTDTVLNTYTTTGTSYEYTSANQITDYGTDQGTVYLRLYQMSASFGRGYVFAVTLPTVF